MIEPTYNGVVSKAWECSPEGTSMYVTTKKLKKCKKMLKAWSKDHFGNVVQRNKRTKGLLWKVEEFSARTRYWDEVERLKLELSNLCDKEEKNVAAEVTHSVVKKWGPEYKILPWYCYPKKT